MAAVKKMFWRSWIALLIVIPAGIMLLFAVTDLKLMNEYRYLDETTILASGQKVSNREFVSEKSAEFDSRRFVQYFMNNAQALNDDVFDFFIKNLYENRYQIHDRYYLHENAFMLLPMHNLLLGKPYAEVWSQYGLLSIIFVKNMMELFNDFSINMYDKINKAVYLAYFLSFALIAMSIFREQLLRIAVLSVLGLMFFANGFQSFLYAPGQVPIRHFFDIFVFWFVWSYGRTEKLNYLLPAMVLSVLSVWISKDFGQFVFASFLGSLIMWILIRLARYSKIDRRELGIVAVSVVLAAVSFRYYPLMQNPGIRYFLDGFYSFEMPWYAFCVFLIVPFGWTALVIMFARLYKSRYLLGYLFALLYGGMLLMYFAWSGLTSHLIQIVVWLAIPFLMLLNHSPLLKNRRLTGTALFSLFVLYAVFLYQFVEEWKKYNVVFQTHVTYRWDSARAGGLISTVNPVRLEDAVEDIGRYEKGDSLYMISKYDDVLTFLSQKQSGLPLFELRSMLVTWDDFYAMKTMLMQKADTLFVDSDILRDFDEEVRKDTIFDMGSPMLLRENLQQRIPKLLVLRELFLQIRDNYSLVKRGDLIDVYQKRVKEGQK